MPDTQKTAHGPKTIDDLFPAILEEVFSHLKASDVKNCALVCKERSEVIGSSAVIMKKFELRFSGMGEEDEDSDEDSKLRRALQLNELQLNELREQCSTRKHRNVSIHILRNRKMKSPISEHFDLSSVKQLKVYAVPTMLSRMPLLEDLLIELGKENFGDADIPIGDRDTCKTHKTWRASEREFNHQQHLQVHQGLEHHRFVIHRKPLE